MKKTVHQTQIYLRAKPQGSAGGASLDTLLGDLRRQSGRPPPLAQHTVAISSLAADLLELQGMTGKRRV